MIRRGWVFILIGFLVFPHVAAQVRYPANWRYPSRYQGGPPLTALQWGYPAAAHLMRRAGFSAAPRGLEKIVGQGVEATLDELLDFENVDDSEMEAALALEDFRLSYEMEEMYPFADILEMNRHWYFRMVNSRRQLVEKMALFWHDHFATSVFAVPFAHPQTGLPLLQSQLETFREEGLGNFRTLVKRIARDPAMVIFLDSFSNVKESPNENFSRELFELFTMGEGSGYSEKDIQEEARAFTGWSLNPHTLEFYYYAQAHDLHYPKVVLGEEIHFASVDSLSEAGFHEGDLVIDIIFRLPAVAEHIATKLWEFFVHPDPAREIILQLADVFRSEDYEIKPLLRAIFSHPHFMSSKAYRAKIKSPVEFTVGAFRELEVHDPYNVPVVSFFFSLGQLLFDPPDVGGWPADQGWINTATILGRYNFMNYFISDRGGLYDGVLPRGEDEIPFQKVIQEYGLTAATSLIDFYGAVLLQGDLSLDSEYSLLEYMNRDSNGNPQSFDVNDPAMVDTKVRGLVYLISLSPAYQLN